MRREVKRDSKAAQSPFKLRDELERLMWRKAGVVRNGRAIMGAGCARQACGGSVVDGGSCGGALPAFGVRLRQ